MDTGCANFHFIVANSMTHVQCAERASLDRTQPETQQTETSLPPLHRPHPHRLHQMTVRPVMRTVPATRKYSVILTSHQTASPLQEDQGALPAQRGCVKLVTASQEGLTLEIIYSTSFFLSCWMDKVLLLWQVLKRQAWAVVTEDPALYLRDHYFEMPTGPGHSLRSLWQNFGNFQIFQRWKECLFFLIIIMRAIVLV